MGSLKNEWDKDGKYYPEWDNREWNSDGRYRLPLVFDKFWFFNDHCDPSVLVYDGPAALKSDKIELPVHFPSAEQDEVAFSFIKGIIPRKPTHEEFIALMYPSMAGAYDMFDITKQEEVDFPNLVNKCWWVSEAVGMGAYNCMGYCTGLLKVEENFRKELSLEQELVRFFGEKEDLEAGYKMIEDFGLIKVIGNSADAIRDEKSKVVVFSQSHVAIKSWFLKTNERLWESKIGGGYSQRYQSRRILHSLKDLEGGHYGNVIAYYKYPG